MLTKLNIIECYADREPKRTVLKSMEQEKKTSYYCYHSARSVNKKTFNLTVEKNNKHVFDALLLGMNLDKYFNIFLIKYFSS